VSLPLDEEEADAGLQAERTSLAWLRTALACAGLAAVASRLTDTPGPRVAAVVAGLLVGVAGLAAWWLRTDRLHGEAPPEAPFACAALLAGAIATADVVAITLLLA
jgi:uncharacterized membrane protein YidH (DUF202 family)